MPRSFGSPIHWLVRILVRREVVASPAHQGSPPQELSTTARILENPPLVETTGGDSEDWRLVSLKEGATGTAFRHDPCLQLLAQKVQGVLDTLTDRESRVLSLRFGLEDGWKRTLKETGNEFGVTRERARQIQSKALRKLRHPSRSRKLQRSLSDLICRHGPVVATNRSNVATFVAHCVGVPALHLEGASILCARESEVATLTQCKTVSEFSEKIRQLAHDLGFDADPSGVEGCLSDADTEVAHQAITRKRAKRVTKAQRVTATLLAIGEPSHYSTITDVYNSMFPDNASSERNIHAVLNREQHGVVWTGRKGTFGLRKWGDKHPSKGLFDTVTEIVQNKFDETAKPVPLAVITVELGKYRNVVPKTSLTFATSRNPELRQIGRDSFVPRGLDDKESQLDTGDQMDSALRNFEERRMA